MGLFTKNGWDKVSKDSSEYIQTKLGADDFTKLTELLKKHNVFENKTFNTSEDFKWLFPFLLSRVGIVIMSQSGDKNDAEFFLRMAILLEDPQSKTTAHSTLALIYYADDKKELAKSEAMIALEVNGKFSDETHNAISKAMKKEPIAPNETQEYRRMLQSIVDGTLNKKDITG